MEIGQPEIAEIEKAVESLPFFGVGQILDDRDALALLRRSQGKLPYLGQELRGQTDRLVEEIEGDLEMSDTDEVIINENILRGIVSLALKVGAAQVLFDAGKTHQEIIDLRQGLQAS